MCTLFKNKKLLSRARFLVVLHVHVSFQIFQANCGFVLSNPCKQSLGLGISTCPAWSKLAKSKRWILELRKRRFSSTDSTGLTRSFPCSVSLASPLLANDLKDAVGENGEFVAFVAFNGNGGVHGGGLDVERHCTVPFLSTQRETTSRRKTRKTEFFKKKTEKHKNKFLLHFFGECPHLPVHTVHGSLSRPKLYRSNMLKLLTAWGKVYRCSICAVLVQSEMCPKCFQMLVHSLSTRRWWTHRQSPPQLAET